MLDTTVLGELADLIGPSESDRENWRRGLPEDLAGLGQRGPLAVSAVLDLGVVAVVRG